MEQNALDVRALNQSQLMELFGVKKTTLSRLLHEKSLPVVEVARGRYTTTQKLVDKWFDEKLKYRKR